MPILNGLKKALDVVQSCAQLLASLAVIFGLWFAYKQVEDYRTRTSADLVLKFGEYLDDDPYLKISQALDTDNKNVKLLQPEGPFSAGDVERYLGVFETLSGLYRNGLITCGMFKTDFSYYIHKAYLNDEIRSYISDLNVDGQNLWPNLVVVGSRFGNGKNVVNCDD